MATRADVARRAGVSPSTVSYVISGQRTISADTRERVTRAMQELDYTPNPFARGLAGARTGIIALHFPPGQHGLTATQFEYVSAAAEHCRRRGCHLLLWSSPIDDLAGLRSLASQGPVDGVIIMEVRAVDPRIRVLQESGRPFAMIGRADDSEGVAYVDNDFESLSRQAIDHIADLGHRHVVHLTNHADLRFRRTLGLPAKRRGVLLTEDFVEGSVTGGHQAFARLGRLTPRPTAIVCAEEMVMLGLFHAAALAGVPIPESLTVVGLTVDGVAAELFTPRLTTVAPPAREIAIRAVDALMDMIEGGARSFPQVLVAPLLFDRGSSAAPPSG